MKIKDKEAKKFDYKGKPVRCIETGEVYKSARQAARETETNLTSIYRVVRGYKNRKKAGGYHWEYADV